MLVRELPSQACLGFQEFHSCFYYDRHVYTFWELLSIHLKRDHELKDYEKVLFQT